MAAAESVRSMPIRITAVDLAAEMLEVAAANVKRCGCEEVVVLERIDAKSLPFEDGAFDAVMSNSIVHHIAEPRVVLAEMLRVLTPGGVLFVRDLLRPEDAEAVERIVQAYAGDENDHQRKMFRESLHAALTLDEIRLVLAAVGRDPAWAQQTSDRHWTIAGRKR